MRLSLLIFIVGCQLVSVAQDPVLDSLNQRLGTQQGEERFWTLDAIRMHYADAFDLPEAIDYGKQLLEMAEGMADKELIVHAQERLARHYTKNGDYMNAIIHYGNVLSEDLIGYASVAELGSVYNGMALSYRSIGDYDAAAASIFNALQMDEIYDPDHVALLADLYMTLGGTYYYQDFNDKALEYFLKALDLFRQQDNEYYVAAMQNNIGSVYSESGMYAEALENFLAAHDYFSSTGNINPLGRILNNIGRVNQYMGNALEALEYYDKALLAGEEVNDQNSVANTYHIMGVAEIDLGRYAEALESLHTSLEMAQALSIRELIKDNYYHMGVAYEALGNLDEAYHYSVQFGMLLDTIHNEEQQSELTFLESKFKFQEQMQEIELAETNLQLQELENEALEESGKRKDLQNYALMGGVGLLLVLGGVIGFGYRNKRRANAVLLAQKEEIEKSRDEIAEKSQIIEEKNKDITDSIKYAERIQRAILTSDEYLSKALPAHFVLYKPRDIVSGDFYWAYRTPDDKVVVAAVDCTGHGVPGAFMSMIGSSLLNEVVVENGTTDAGAILDSLKDGVIRSLKQKGAAFEARDGMDVALCVWDKRTSEVNYAGANNPLYHITEGELNVVIPDKMACGWEPDATGTFRSHTIQAKPGDWFYIFSDGYVDQFGGPKGKKFKAAQLKALLMKSHTLPPQRQLEVLDQTIENWRGELEQIDDICFIGFAT